MCTVTGTACSGQSFRESSLQEVLCARIFASISLRTTRSEDSRSFGTIGVFAISEMGRFYRLVKTVDTVEPEPELVAKYEERYQKFKKLYPTVKVLFTN